MNTADKRFSLMGLGFPPLRVYPFPDSSIDAGDRWQYLWLYRDFTAKVIPPGIGAIYIERYDKNGNLIGSTVFYRREVTDCQIKQYNRADRQRNQNGRRQEHILQSAAAHGKAKSRRCSWSSAAFQAAGSSTSAAGTGSSCGRWTERWERFGVERSTESVNLLRQRISGLRLVAGDIHSGELIPGAFDALTFWHVLEHLPDPEAALARAATLLRPGGWVFVSLPCIDSLQALLFLGYLYGFDDVPRHLHHFSGRSLTMRLTRTAFTVRRQLMFSRNVASSNTLSPWAQRLVYLTGSCSFCTPGRSSNSRA